MTFFKINVKNNKHGKESFKPVKIVMQRHRTRTKIDPKRYTVSYYKNLAFRV